MQFQRRDIVLIVGTFLIVLGITQYVPFEYSVMIGIVLYFSIKLYAEKRRQSVAREVGEGICMECGSKIVEKKCPNCDSTAE